MAHDGPTSVAGFVAKSGDAESQSKDSWDGLDDKILSMVRVIARNAGRQPYSGAPRDGIIVGPDETAPIPGDIEGPNIRVTQNVYREFFPLGSNRPSYVILHKMGSLIPRTTVVPSQ